MSEDIAFGSLEEVPVRSAWNHEALGFTPWLAKNLDRLSAALGIPLELENTEVPVGRYAADILARNPRDGRPVLIENQLEDGDHRHLGQILTYLTGLSAEIIVWVAPSFREEHLSAIRWLNEHTKDPFAFFAVKLRVVRIGTSPLAPLFEVLERPNGWDRQVEESARASQEQSPVAARRRAFWARYVKLYPEAAADTVGGGGISRWRVLPGLDLVVSQWFAVDSVGVFVRGGRGNGGEAIRERLAPHAEALESLLGASMADPRYPFLKRRSGDTSDAENWDTFAKWLHDETERYAAALNNVLGAKD